MKRTVAVCAILMLAGAVNAAATLVGDSVDVHISISNIGMSWSDSTIVASDASDKLFWIPEGYPPLLSVDPYASGFVVTNVSGSGLNRAC